MCLTKLLLFKFESVIFTLCSIQVLYFNLLSGVVFQNNIYLTKLVHLAYLRNPMVGWKTQSSQDHKLNKCITKFCLLKEPCEYRFFSVKHNAFHTVTRRKIYWHILDIYLHHSPKFYFSENEVRWLNPSFPNSTEIIYAVAHFLYVKKEKEYSYISKFVTHYKVEY
jgi:hypothetical protein